MREVFNIDRLGYTYLNTQVALEDITFRVQEGEQVAIIGANASGKSTLLSILDGLMFGTSGAATAFGRTLSEKSLDGTDFGRFFRKQVAFLFQNVDAQLFCSSVDEELAFGPRHLGIREEEIDRRVDDLVETFNLRSIRHRAPQTLSGGEKRRVGLAAVLALAPSVVLLDEPTSGLDPRNRAFFIDSLRGLADGGKTLIVATHDLEMAHSVAQRAIVLSEDHQMAADGEIHEILNDNGLLADVNLVHAHEHLHGGRSHAHPHYHSGRHEHEHLPLSAD